MCSRLFTASSRLGRVSAARVVSLGLADCAPVHTGRRHPLSTTVAPARWRQFVSPPSRDSSQPGTFPVHKHGFATDEQTWFSKHATIENHWLLAHTLIRRVLPPRRRCASSPGTGVASPASRRDLGASGRQPRVSPRRADGHPAYNIVVWLTHTTVPMPRSVPRPAILHGLA